MRATTLTEPTWRKGRPPSDWGQAHTFAVCCPTRQEYIIVTSSEDAPGFYVGDGTEMVEWDLRWRWVHLGGAHEDPPA